ncbi:MAG: DUF1697 domain-containing protein [Acidobacteriota bacterium]|nr:DUF1697 domain-containing protein [Acidobacteriota bacterium]
MSNPQQTEMIKYAAFLRGINVGGHHLVKMEDLRRVFEAMNFTAVKTYIQSGNVIFRAAAEETSAGELEEKIERELREAFGFEVRAMLRTLDELEEIVARNPFKEPEAGAKAYISFLSAAPDAGAKESLESLSNDFEVFRFGGVRELYSLLRPGKPGKELFSNNFIEKRLKVAATTRNPNTVNKVLLLK